MNYIPVTQSRRHRKNKEMASGTKAVFARIQSLLCIAAWAVVLHLFQPFITAVVCWKGYEVIIGNVSSLSTIDEFFIVLEYIVQFGTIVVLLLLSWSEWNHWRFPHLVKSSFFVNLHR